MLTREMAIAEFDRERIVPDRLTRKTHGRYLGYAERMLRVYRRGVGLTRQALHRAVWNVFADEEDCPARRIEAFCKLLDDAAAFHRDRRGKAAALRREVFRMAAASHPLVRSPDRLFDHAETDVKAEIAQRLGRSWTDIDAELFADVIEFHRLARFDGYPDAAALLARYNVAQVQAALFGAASMRIWATEDFKTILRYAKLARLMHTIARQGPGRYRIDVDGPASALRETRRYGAAMARFLPALVACRGWRMHAVVRTRRQGWTVGLDLSSADGLTSHLPPPEAFDSTVEQSFADKWGPEPRDGWRLVREGEILHRGQHVFVPDFSFHHADGRTALMEIVGFWTPEYIEAKLHSLAQFPDARILVAAAESVRQRLGPWADRVIPFKSALALKDVLERLTQL
ncbi:MAG: DUF790 family protein [Pirellulales bacterium]|nr:DUF790 family protein [Pirellulales bacterium]